MAQKNSTFVIWLIGLVFLGAGYYAGISRGLPILENAKASESWPSVVGTISQSEVNSHRDSDNKTMYTADVAYTYTVENHDLRGDVVWFGGNYSSSSSGEIYETVNRYQKGQIVDVFYNPDIHTISVLEPGAKMSSYMLFGFGMVFFGVGVILIGSRVLKLLVVLILIFKS